MKEKILVGRSNILRRYSTRNRDISYENFLEKMNEKIIQENQNRIFLKKIKKLHNQIIKHVEEKKRKYLWVHQDTFKI